MLLSVEVYNANLVHTKSLRCKQCAFWFLKPTFDGITCFLTQVILCALKVFCTVGLSTDIPRDYRGKETETIYIDEPVVSILHPSISNYYHWTAEVSTRRNQVWDGGVITNLTFGFRSIDIITMIDWKGHKK